jgi:hypothetical protein
MTMTTDKRKTMKFKIYGVARTGGVLATVEGRPGVCYSGVVGPVRTYRGTEIWSVYGWCTTCTRSTFAGFGSGTTKHKCNCVQ